MSLKSVQPFRKSSMIYRQTFIYIYIYRKICEITQYMCVLYGTGVIIKIKNELPSLVE